MNKMIFYINKWIKGIQYKKFCKTYSRQEAYCNDCPYFNGEKHGGHNYYCDKLGYTGTSICYANEVVE